MTHAAPPPLDFVRKTPLVFAPPLNCWLKLESLQATGSFKVRGAALKLSRMTPEERARGVVTASAGNPGQGVALAASRLGIPAAVVVPAICPQVKRDGMTRYGAEVIVDGATYDEAHERALALAKARYVPYVSAYDDDDIIAGNGEWLGRELAKEHAGLSRVIVPVGGGGLVSGLLRALPGVAVHGVQPRVNCAMHDSLVVGRALVENRGEPVVKRSVDFTDARELFAGRQIPIPRDRRRFADPRNCVRSIGRTVAIINQP
jgi:threonine dehydratase